MINRNQPKLDNRSSQQVRACNIDMCGQAVDLEFDLRGESKSWGRTEGTPLYMWVDQSPAPLLAHFGYATVYGRYEYWTNSGAVFLDFHDHHSR